MLRSRPKLGMEEKARNGPTTAPDHPMSASAFAPLFFSPAQRMLGREPAHQVEQRQERCWIRWLRWHADRRHLREMDAHLLCDVGLTRDDVHRGAPFHTTPPRPAWLIRIGTLDARACRLKFYTPAAEASGLRPKDLAAARRAFRAVLAEPGCEPVAGFAILTGPHDAALPTGSLVLTAYRWEGTVLRRCALLLPVADAPVHRLSDHGLSLAEVRLATREGHAWQRHAARPSSSTLAAYIAEDCA